jgi:hypothetical protein
MKMCTKYGKRHRMLNKTTKNKTTPTKGTDAGR